MSGTSYVLLANLRLPGLYLHDTHDSSNIQHVEALPRALKWPLNRRLLILGHLIWPVHYLCCPSTPWRLHWTSPSAEAYCTVEWQTRSGPTRPTECYIISVRWLMLPVTNPYRKPNSWSQINEILPVLPVSSSLPSLLRRFTPHVHSRTSISFQRGPWKLPILSDPTYDLATKTLSESRTADPLGMIHFQI